MLRATFPVLAAATLALAFAGLAAPAGAAEPIPGPIRAQVLRVIDGDTIEARAEVWPGVLIQVKVRLAGLDTPERRGKCDGEVWRPPGGPNRPWARFWTAESPF